MCEAIEGIYQDGRAKGRKEGREEGREEGRREGSANMLLLILGKLGGVSGELERRIRRETDLGRIEAWFQKAVEVNSMEEFLQSM